MTATIVQETVAAASNIPFASAQTAGNTNIAIVIWDDNTTVFTAPSDNNGAYTIGTLQQVPNGAAGYTMAICYRENIASAAPGANAVNYSGSFGSGLIIAALEVSGLPLSSVADGGSGSGAGSASGAPSSSGTLAAGNEWVLSVGLTSNNITAPGSGFTFVSGGTFFGGKVAYEFKTFPSAGPYTAAYADTGGSVGAAALAFKLLAGPNSPSATFFGSEM